MERNAKWGGRKQHRREKRDLKKNKSIFFEEEKIKSSKKKVGRPKSMTLLKSVGEEEFIKRKPTMNEGGGIPEGK